MCTEISRFPLRGQRFPYSLFGVGPNAAALFEAVNQPAVVRKDDAGPMFGETSISHEGSQLGEKGAHFGNLARTCVHVNARKDVKDLHAGACYLSHMDNDWLDRLIQAIEADGRKPNRLSEDAGLGRNYVQQLLNRRSAPHSKELAKLLDALGEEAALFVHTGHRLTAVDWEFLRASSGMDEDTRKDALRLLRRLADHSEEPKQSPGALVEVPSKLGTD